MNTAHARLQVIYICGAGRSGSTLLEMLLRERLQVVAGGEVRQVWGAGLRRNARCECGEPFASCSLWQSATGHLHALGESDRGVEAHGRRLLRYRNVRRLAQGPAHWTKQEQTFAELTWKVYEELASHGEGCAVLDSSKTSPHALLLAANPDFDVHVIHLVRDSRAVAYSWQRRKVWRASTRDAGRTRLMKRRSAVSVSRIWMVQNMLAGLLRRHVTSYRRLRYEDLVGAHDAVLDDLTERLPVAPREESDERLPEEHHGFMGNPVRFEAGDRAIRLDDSWRTAMRRRERFTVTALTAPGLCWFGYRLRIGSSGEAQRP